MSGEKLAITESENVSELISELDEIWGALKILDTAGTVAKEFPVDRIPSGLALLLRKVLNGTRQQLESLNDALCCSVAGTTTGFVERVDCISGVADSSVIGHDSSLSFGPSIGHSGNGASVRGTSGGSIGETLDGAGSGPAVFSGCSSERVATDTDASTVADGAVTA